MSRPSRYGARPRVLFVNDLWGYGTVTMALAIADEVGDDVTRLFAGTGPGFELARRFPFDGLMNVDTRAEPLAQELTELIDECQVVVSVMNGPVAGYAVERGIPCVYADCLTWMWAEPPPIPAGVPYFAEAFPGADLALERWRGRLGESQVVGPLVRRPAHGRPSFQDVILVNFGGLFSWLVGAKSLAAYADAMTRCVLRAVDGWRGRVVVAVGDHAQRRMNKVALRALRPGLELVDLSNDSYLAELRRARVLFSSAGMHAIYEACAHSVPCVCLPSQNLSGSLALQQLRSTGVVSALDWSDFYPVGALRAADEAAACRRIDQQIHRFSRDANAQDELVAHLREAFETNLDDLQRRQAEFSAAQGSLGAPTVAARIRELLDPHPHLLVAEPAVAADAAVPG